MTTATVRRRRLEEDGSIRVRPKNPATDRLRDVQQKLSKRDVDLDEMRRKSKSAWSPHDGAEESA